MDLSGKIFLITGVSKGIGNALAKRLDAEGANLILVSRNTKNIGLDPKHTLINADLTKKEDIRNLLEEIANIQIDALLNVAGVGFYKPLENLTEDNFRESLDLNLIAPFVLTKGLYKNLEKSELSLILSIGSGAGVMPFKNRSAYTASKFGLRGMVLSLAEEFESRKPHFCLITLGSTITTFGGKSIEKQEKDSKSGKKVAFPVDWLANKLIEIIKDTKRKTEIVLYPFEYGKKAII